VLQKLQRPLTEKERRGLKGLLEHKPFTGVLSSTARWLGLWTAVLALCIFVFVKGLGREGGPSQVWRGMVPVAFILGVLAFYAVYMFVSSCFRLMGYRRQFRRERLPEICKALEQGGASVCRVTSGRVMVIEGNEDEEAAYIYDLGDGTSFILRGEDYCPETADGADAPWPAGRFEIVRSAANDLLVGVFAGGERLEPAQTVSMKEMPESFWSGEEPKTETVLPGRPEEVLKRLGYKPAMEKD
jgi:hypothetical protein